MNFLPKEIEDIIIDYKTQVEYFEYQENLKQHKKKFSKCCNSISNITYQINHINNTYCSIRTKKYQQARYYIMDTNYRDCIVWCSFTNYHILNLDSNRRDREKLWKRRQIDQEKLWKRRQIDIVKQQTFFRHSVLRQLQKAGKRKTFYKRFK